MALRLAGFRPSLLVGLVACAAPATLGSAAQPADDGRAPRSLAREAARVTQPARTPDPLSNMGFLWQGDFAAVPGFKNIYLVAVPYFHGQEDIANSSRTDACDPAGGVDGVVNADDLLCAWWSSREGAMSLSRRDEPGGTWQTRTAFRDDTTRQVVFLGPWTEPLVPAEAFLMQVAGPNGGAASNRTHIAGSHDPGYSGHVLRLPNSGEGQESLINLPFHTMYQTADEVLCGLEGLDWIEGPDGNPTTCPTGTGAGGTGGIFDNVSGARMTFMCFDNVPDGNGTDNQWVWRTVSKDPITGALIFEGADFDPWPLGVSPPAGLASYGPPFTTSIFLSPHF